MNCIIWLKRLIIRLPFWLPDFVLYLLQSVVYLVHYRRWLVNCKDANILEDRYDLFTMFNIGIINYYEFGVASGTSLNWWVKNNKSRYSKFYGFDTFEGLPERWGVYAKGAMASNIPKIDDHRVTFVKGMFQDTLPILTTPRIVHIDCDLYNSTSFILNNIKWQQGDVILFDDFNVMAHVFRAFWEWADSTKLKYKVIATTKHNSQIAIIVAGR